MPRFVKESPIISQTNPAEILCTSGFQRHIPQINHPPDGSIHLHRGIEMPPFRRHFWNGKSDDKTAANSEGAAQIPTSPSYGTHRISSHENKVSKYTNCKPEYLPDHENRTRPIIHLKPINMKTLAIPFVTLLLFSACTKEDMPVPADTHRSSERQSGDTITRVIRTLGEHGPLPNEIGPKIPHPVSEHEMLGRMTGDTIRRVTLTPGEHKPLTNIKVPVVPKK